MLPSLLHLPFLPLLLALAGLPGHLQLPWSPIPCTCNCYFPPYKPPPRAQNLSKDRTESVGFVRLNTFAKICASCRFCGLDDPNMYQKLPKMFKTSSLRGKSAPKVVPMADRGGQGTSKRPEKEPRGPPWAPLGGPWGRLVRPKGSEMEP